MIELRKLTDRVLPAAGASKPLPAPRGIGSAVSFDWGISCELLILGSALALGAGPGASFAHMPLPARLGAGLLTIGFAAGAFALGEAMRRGRRLAWLPQVVFNSLIPLGGLGMLPVAVDSLRHGRFGPAVVAAIMLVVSPIIAWRLTRPETRMWFGGVSSAAARQRHGGTWLISPLLFALAGGIAVAFQRFF